MKKPITHYQIILDESGSMNDCYTSTMQGLLEQKNKIAELAIKYPDQEIRVSLTNFNDLVNPVFRHMNALDFHHLQRINYRPSGCTALFDAIGTCIYALQKQKFEKEDTFVVIIITDGHENASHLFSHDKIKSMISELENTNKWTFTYLGATFDSIDIATDLNIKQQNSTMFSKKYMKEQIWDNLGDSFDHYLAKKQKGDKLSDFLNSNHESTSSKRS
jgi:hypothetical protein